jgi:ankyrin repeat protein
MGFVLLWVESLVLVLVCIAVVYAISGRWQKHLWRIILRAAFFLLPVLCGGFFIFIAGYLRQNNIKPDWLLLYAVSWTVAFIVGFVFIRRYAMMGEGEEQACGSWPRPTLFGVVAVFLALLGITYLKMDIDARARLASRQTSGLASAVRVLPDPVPNQENAGLIYLQAAELIDLPEWASKIEQPGYTPDLEKAEAVSANHRQALGLLKRAAEMPYVSFMPEAGKDRYWPSFQSELIPVFKLIKVCRLLALQAYVDVAMGKTNVALAAIKTIEDLAGHISRCPNLISVMAGGRMLQMQKAALERFLAFSPNFKPDPMLPPVTVDSVILESFRRAMVMEDSMFLYSFSRDVLSDRICDIADTFGDDIFDYVICLFPYRVFMSKGEFEFYDQYWPETHAFISQPIYQMLEKHKEWQSEVMKHPGGIISAISYSNWISKSYIHANMFEACNRLTDLAKAVSAYHAGKGVYPARINDLVPAYIREMPVDPFDGKPLKMIPKKDGLIIYSIGPDFKDNGGTVAYDSSYNEKKTGDIIFHVGSAYDRAFLKPALSRLAANGNLEMVQRALAAGADVNQDAPLVGAAAAGHSGVVRLLLEKGADIDAITKPLKKKKRGKKRAKRLSFKDREGIIGGRSALMAAAANGHHQTIQLLLEKGAAPKAANQKGRSAILIAPGTGLLMAGEWMARELETLHNIQMEIQVLEARVKAFDAKTGGLFEKESDVKALRRAEADLKRAQRRIQELKETKIPAQVAAPEHINRRSLTINLLLASGADVNAMDKLGITPLMAAAFEGDAETVQLLLERGADINSRNRFGWTPLIAARANGNQTVERLLTEKGASLTAKDTEAFGRLVNSLERLKKARQRKRKK